MKQSKLRRRRVIRYAILYFLMLFLFVALIAGPIIVGDQGLLPDNLSSDLSFGLGLMQPTGLENDDTEGRRETGTGAADYSGAWTPTDTIGSADATATGRNNRIRLF